MSFPQICPCGHVAQAGFDESVAHAVDVEAELPGGEPFAVRASFCSRAAAASATSDAAARGMTTMPSSSAATTSPGWISAPPHTTGMFTEPTVAFTVPLAEMARDHTGN